MQLSYKKISGIGLAALSLALIIWGANHSADSAKAQSAVSSEVLVAVCGNGTIEAPVEECDNGSHCANLTSCTSDVECAGIGDGLCKKRNYGGCSATCMIIIGGGASQPTEVVIAEIWAYPEQRSGAAGTNYDTDYFFSIHDADNASRETLYQHFNLLSSTNAGTTSLFLTLPGGIIEGIYDVAIKPEAHLSRVLNNAFLQVGENILNFTSESNSPSIGSVRLIAGDINGAGLSPSTMGDDVINAIDLSVLLSDFGNSDPSGSARRANLNQDNVVNQEDLNILLGNLDKEGDL